MYSTIKDIRRPVVELMGSEAAVCTAFQVAVELMLDEAVAGWHGEALLAAVRLLPAGRADVDITTSPQVLLGVECERIELGIGLHRNHRIIARVPDRSCFRHSGW